MYLMYYYHHHYHHQPLRHHCVSSSISSPTSSINHHHHLLCLLNHTLISCDIVLVCSANLDLGFIVPISSRKKRQPFVDVEVSRLIRQVVSRFQVSPKDTEVSVVTYGTTPKMAFSFNRLVDLV